jgi:HAD superfamily hydrolase (TIGR01509 family)
MAKTVVLDVDGTLMDTNYLHTEAWARAFEDVGHRVPRVELHHQIGKSSELLVREFVDDDETVEKIQALHAEYFARFQEHGHALPGAKELLSKLADAGHPVWLATSANDEELEHHMDQLEAGGKVAGVVNPSAVESGKPAPDIFEEALRRAGAPADDTVAVGDAIWDVESAKRAGIRTVAVLSGGAFSPQELKEAGAAEVHKDCAALIRAGFPE